MKLFMKSPSMVYELQITINPVFEENYDKLKEITNQIDLIEVNTSNQYEKRFYKQNKDKLYLQRSYWNFKERLDKLRLNISDSEIIEFTI